MTEAKKKQPAGDGEGGAPEWMVTFSDCMTLLLTFFVLLLSFSSFDDKEFKRVSVMYSLAMPSVNLAKRVSKDSFTPADQIEYTKDLDAGSEKPTLDRSNRNSSRKDTEPPDFRRQRVFMVASKKVFWGKGSAISLLGKDLFATMALYLQEIPDRVVISENGPVERGSGAESGLRRAWVVVNYLASRHGLSKERFSIAGSSTVPRVEAAGQDERMLEIVLLEGSICN